MELSGRTALVTGAAGGIGRAIAVRLAAAGARIALVDRDAAALARVAADLGDSATPFVVDLADPGSIASGIAAVLAQFERVDILVNNAGILSPNKLAGTTLAEWQALMAVNLDAAFLLTQAVVPGMRANGWGRLINMSSYAWKSGGLTAGTAYSVSKAAMVGLTFSSARELTGTGITANAVAPAYVVSPMIMEQLTETQRAAQLAAIPVGRFCEPEEVAHTVAFLASPLAGFITGGIIDMNGGL
ncbi:MAG: SDR family oxidoreductase, partial [Sphingomonas sp.]